MSRNIRQAVPRPDREQQRRERGTGKVLITACPSGLYAKRGHAPDSESKCLLAALFGQDRLTAVQTFSPDLHSRIGAVYLGKIKKIVRNLNACFVEIAGGEQCFLHMGGENDAPFLTNRTYDGRLMEGDELPVQIRQEAIKTKQAAVSTRITMQGEFFVLATGTSRPGISRKLGETQKILLRDFLERMKITDQDGLLVQEEGVPLFGLVARTRAGLILEQAAPDCEDVLYGEYERLRRQFTSVFLQGRHRTCYSCLHEAGSALQEALGPFLPDEYEQVVTDLMPIYEELSQLQQQGRFSLEKKQIRLYQDPDLPLYKLYSLETRLVEAMAKTVWLKSGANLVIEQTESLTAIDVNTGKCTLTSGGESGKASSAEVMRRVNLEAAGEVARQLRLRNLSGIIIVDFINLATLAQEEELLQKLREMTEADPVTVQVVDMTPLGLVEITRKKMYPSLREQLGKATVDT